MFPPFTVRFPACPVTATLVAANQARTAYLVAVARANLPEAMREQCKGPCKHFWISQDGIPQSDSDIAERDREE